MRSTVVLFALMLSGCGAVKSYQLPLAPNEGAQLVPALIAASQELGLYSFRGKGALVELEDGSQLSWEPGADGRDFMLFITIPNGVPEEERTAYFAAAKSKADEIWNRATRRHQAPPPAAR